MQTQIALIVEADEPALFYESISDAEIDLESYDVEDGVYKSAFGPNGEVYDISTDGDSVIIRRVEGQVDLDGLRVVLVRFVNRNDEPEEQWQHRSIDDLLEECIPYIKHPR